ncbi:MAG: hypothetical protein AAFR76_07395 [Planctomycetota bacterium]
MSDMIPNDLLGKIEFFEQRIADWAANVDQIGLTAQQANDLVGRVAAARAAYNAAQQIRQQSRNATATQRIAVNEMARFGSDLISTIRSFADLQPDPNAVYVAAEINPPTPAGTPLPPPVPATDVVANLQQSGAVLVSWKGTTANGTFYDVYRQLTSTTGSRAGFTLIGSSATRSFEDTTVPAGTTQVSYYTVARRDAFTSAESQQAVLRFGMPNLQSSLPGENGRLGLAA